jgi:hypothetical protein
MFCPLQMVEPTFRERAGLVLEGLSACIRVESIALAVAPLLVCR